MFSFNLKSHPDKLLRNHLKNVGKLSEDIVSSKRIQNKEIFSKVAYIIGISHDFGKATKAFQDYLITKERTKYAKHGFLSSLFGYYTTKIYLNKINELEKFWYMPIIAWIIINKHHGSLGNIRGTDGEIDKLKDEGEIKTAKKQIDDIVNNNMDEIKRIYSELLEDFEIQGFFNIFVNCESLTKFTEEIRTQAKKLCKEKNMDYYYSILFFYSVLLDSDKLDASETRIPDRIKTIRSNIVNDYKVIKFGASKTFIDSIRERAYNEVNNSLQSLDITSERILSINLPTGMGKTLTGFSLALNLRERIAANFGFTPKIIYALPFLSIIDQNSEVIEKVFRESEEYKEIPSNLLLKHHHLADVEYREKKTEDNELNIIEDINNSLLLTEGWHSEIIITTFVQLFHSLITNKNRAARKFHNMTNSIIILDEIQSIPHCYWLLVKEALKYMADNFNCWIILMTATKPLIFEGERETRELAKNREEYFRLFDRVEYNFDLNEKDFNKFKDEIFNELLNNKDKDFMIVLNTINSCKELYTYLKNKFSDHYHVDSKKCLDKDGICIFPDLELINLSTHILPKYRLNRIEKIKLDNKRKIIVSTQLIEAGVDISVDIIYRDMAPLDCLIQTAGRCNRENKEKKGLVNIILLKDEKHKRPFLSYIYDSVLVDATKEIIKKFGNKVSEKDFVLKSADEYYKLISERTSEEDSRRIVECLRNLNFYDINEFKLIKEKSDSISIFVEIDEEAERTIKEIEKTVEQSKGYEKRRNLMKIKKDINQYTLSIESNKMKEKIIHSPTFKKIGAFTYIPKEEISKWYQPDTGFEVDQK